MMIMEPPVPYDNDDEGSDHARGDDDDDDDYRHAASRPQHEERVAAAVAHPPGSGLRRHRQHRQRDDDDDDDDSTQHATPHGAMTSILSAAGCSSPQRDGVKKKKKKKQSSPSPRRRPQPQESATKKALRRRASRYFHRGGVNGGGGGANDAAPPPAATKRTVDTGEKAGATATTTGADPRALAVDSNSDDATALATSTSTSSTVVVVVPAERTTVAPPLPHPQRRTATLPARPSYTRPPTHDNNGNASSVRNHPSPSLAFFPRTTVSPKAHPKAAKKTKEDNSPSSSRERRATASSRAIPKTSKIPTAAVEANCVVVVVDDPSLQAYPSDVESRCSTNAASGYGSSAGGGGGSDLECAARRILRGGRRRRRYAPAPPPSTGSAEEATVVDRVGKGAEAKDASSISSARSGGAAGRTKALPRGWKERIERKTGKRVPGMPESKEKKSPPTRGRRVDGVSGDSDDDGAAAKEREAATRRPVGADVNDAAGGGRSIGTEGDPSPHRNTDDGDDGGCDLPPAPQGSSPSSEDGRMTVEGREYYAGEQHVGEAKENDHVRPPLPTTTHVGRDDDEGNADAGGEDATEEYRVDEGWDWAGDSRNDSGEFGPAVAFRDSGRDRLNQDRDGGNENEGRDESVDKGFVPISIQDGSSFPSTCDDPEGWRTRIVDYDQNGRNENVCVLDNKFVPISNPDESNSSTMCINPEDPTNRSVDADQHVEGNDVLVKNHANDDDYGAFDPKQVGLMNSNDEYDEGGNDDNSVFNRDAQQHHQLQNTRRVRFSPSVEGGDSKDADSDAPGIVDYGDDDDDDEYFHQFYSKSSSEEGSITQEIQWKEIPSVPNPQCKSPPRKNGPAMSHSPASTGRHGPRVETAFNMETFGNNDDDAFVSKRDGFKVKQGKFHPKNVEDKDNPEWSVPKSTTPTTVESLESLEENVDAPSTDENYQDEDSARSDAQLTASGQSTSEAPAIDPHPWRGDGPKNESRKEAEEVTSMYSEVDPHPWRGDGPKNKSRKEENATSMHSKVDPHPWMGDGPKNESRREEDATTMHSKVDQYPLRGDGPKKESRKQEEATPMPSEVDPYPWKGDGTEKKSPKEDEATPMPHWKMRKQIAEKQQRAAGKLGQSSPDRQETLQLQKITEKQFKLVTNCRQETKPHREAAKKSPPRTEYIFADAKERGSKSHSSSKQAAHVVSDDGYSDKGYGTSDAEGSSPGRRKPRRSLRFFRSRNRKSNNFEGGERTDSDWESSADERGKPNTFALSPLRGRMKKNISFKLGSNRSPRRRRLFKERRRGKSSSEAEDSVADAAYIAIHHKEPQSEVWEVPNISVHAYASETACAHSVRPFQIIEPQDEFKDVTEPKSEVDPLDSNLDDSRETDVTSNRTKTIGSHVNHAKETQSNVIVSNVKSALDTNINDSRETQSTAMDTLDNFDYFDTNLNDFREMQSTVMNTQDDLDTNLNGSRKMQSTPTKTQGDLDTNPNDPSETNSTPMKTQDDFDNILNVSREMHLTTHVASTNVASDTKLNESTWTQSTEVTSNARVGYSQIPSLLDRSPATASRSSAPSPHSKSPHSRSNDHAKIINKDSQQPGTIIGNDFLDQETISSLGSRTMSTLGSLATKAANSPAISPKTQMRKPSDMSTATDLSELDRLRQENNRLREELENASQISSKVSNLYAKTLRLENHRLKEELETTSSKLSGVGIRHVQNPTDSMYKSTLETLLENDNAKDENKLRRHTAARQETITDFEHLPPMAHLINGVDFDDDSITTYSLTPTEPSNVSQVHFGPSENQSPDLFSKTCSKIAATTRTVADQMKTVARDLTNDRRENGQLCTAPIARPLECFTACARKDKANESMTMTYVARKKPNPSRKKKSGRIRRIDMASETSTTGSSSKV